MSPTRRILVVQTGIGVLCSTGFFIYDTSAGMASLIAMLNVLLPAAYFAWVQARTFNAARLLYQGVSKMLVTAVLMAVSLVVLKVEPLGFFSTFAAMHLGYLAGLTNAAER